MPTPESLSTRRVTAPNQRGVTITQASNGGYIISDSYGIAQMNSCIANTIDEALSKVKEKLSEQDILSDNMNLNTFGGTGR